MPIAIRGSTPAIFTSTVATVSGTLNSTRQPQAGDQLVIIHCNNFYVAANMPTPSVGGSTTGVGAITGGSADAGSNLAHIKTYIKDVAASGDLAVSVTETAGGDEEKALIVYVLAGSNGVDNAAGGSGSASTSWVCPTVTGTAGGLLICHGNSGGGASAGTATWPITEQYDQIFGGVNLTGATESLTGGATGTRTATMTNSLAYATVSIAVAAAGGGGGSAWTYGYDVTIGV